MVFLEYDLNLKASWQIALGVKRYNIYISKKIGGKGGVFKSLWGHK